MSTVFAMLRKQSIGINTVNVTADHTIKRETACCVRQRVPGERAVAKRLRRVFLFFKVFENSECALIDGGEASSRGILRPQAVGAFGRPIILYRAKKGRNTQRRSVYARWKRW